MRAQTIDDKMMCALNKGKNKIIGAKNGKYQKHSEKIAMYPKMMYITNND